MTLAILCSGQGRQHVEMFALTGQLAEAEPLFGHARSLLDGVDPRDLVRKPGAAIFGNRVAQILCTLQALAAATAFGEMLRGSIVVAGYSVGEVAAWGVAGRVPMTQTLDLVSRRADLMMHESSGEEGLLAVRGLTYECVQLLCRQHDVAIAIVNPDSLFIVGGRTPALRAFGESARQLGAIHVTALAIEVASHTRFLAAASPKFREELDKVTLTPSSPRLLSGIDGAPVLDARAGLDKLAAQLSQPIQWSACLHACIEAGASAFLELGPGRSLRDMVFRAYPDVPARALDDFRTLDGARDWLALFQA